MTNNESGFVLIVDDTPTNLAVISEALSDAGFETAVATSGERALKQIDRRSPDLILLDVMMPGIDGFELCRRLKADPLHQEVPIIFMTALADVNSKVQGFELGAVDYITKPFQEREVLARVGTHLNLKATQEKLKQSEARLETILNSLDEIVWSAKLQPFQFIHINPVVEKVCGIPAQTLLENSAPWLNNIHPEDLERITQLFLNPQHQQRIVAEYRLKDAQGEIRWLKTKAKIRFCENQQQFIADGITHDISERKQAESQLHYTACHDDLTGLVNRSYFIQAVDQVLTQQTQERFAVLFIDLDRFKTVNDSLGHHRGDQLLIKIAKILSQSVRPVDVVARLGGDEFTILLRNLCDDDEVQVIIGRLQQKLETSFELDENITVAMSASIGVVVGSSKYSSALDLLRDADIAMYQAKKLGKACHQLFSEDMYETALKKINLEKDMRLALRHCQEHRSELTVGEVEGAGSNQAQEPSGSKLEFMLYYQPIFALSHLALIGFEALARWHHPTMGMISPAEFIPLAEETGLIVPMGEEILRQALAQLQDWQTRYPSWSKLTMSINLSSRQLQDPDFLAMVDQAVLDYGIHPSSIKLEITESLLMQGGEAGFAILNELRARGFSLSLDDFGTGYSSLSYLHRFPINTLKIDRSFVQKLEPGVSSFEIVRTITELARSLRMDVIAEGVETTQQSDHLKSLDCEMVQGYFFSKPLAPSAADEYLAEIQAKLMLAKDSSEFQGAQAEHLKMLTEDISEEGDIAAAA